ncbi:RasGTPase-activating protein [Pelomyxa schiedti]|nr:RasGTPase-activating protein [Pelomyxa schiedti]
MDPIDIDGVDVPAGLPPPPDVPAPPPPSHLPASPPPPPPPSSLSAPTIFQPPSFEAPSPPRPSRAPPTLGAATGSPPHTQPRGPVVEAEGSAAAVADTPGRCTATTPSPSPPGSPSPPLPMCLLPCHSWSSASSSSSTSASSSASASPSTSPPTMGFGCGVGVATITFGGIQHPVVPSLGSKPVRPLLGRRPANQEHHNQQQQEQQVSLLPASASSQMSTSTVSTSISASSACGSSGKSSAGRALGKRSTTMDNLMEIVNTFKSALLTIHLTGGTNLKTKGGKARPSTFCEIYLLDGTPTSPTPKKNRSKLIESDSNPVWDEEFSIEVPPSTKALRIDVQSCGKLSKDKLVGYVEVPFADFSHWQSNGVAPMCVEKGSKATGEISFSLSFTTAMDRNKYLRISKDSYDQLQSILTNPDLFIIMAICRALWNSLEDAFSLALIRLFQQKGLARILVVKLLTREVTMASETTFLRQNTLATRVTMHYFKLIGFGYITAVLKPHIENLLADASVGADLKEGDGFAANVRLAVLSQAILDSLFQTTNLMPLNMRLVLWEVKQILIEQGRSQLSSTLAIAIFFLRYFCPAVFFPEQFYITSAPITPESRRALTLIAKVIQSLANASRQDDPHENSHMEIITQLIEPLREPMDRFTISIMEKPESGPPDETHSQLEEEDYPKLMAIVVRKLAENFTNIEESIKTSNDTCAEDYLAIAEFEVLKSIIIG